MGQDGSDGLSGWTVSGADFEGWLSSEEAEEAIPTTFALHQNYPNPFNSFTHIKFDLPEAGRVKLVIYNVPGRRVRILANGWREAGYHKVTFDGSGLSSGIYLARLTAGDFTQTQKLVLLK